MIHLNSAHALCMASLHMPNYGAAICNMNNTAIIITSMDNRLRHTCNPSIIEARALQTELSARVIRNGTLLNPRFIAGIDVSVARYSKSGRASVVILDNPSMVPVEACHAEGTLHFPYVPGYLSFRETPLIMEAWQKLSLRPDLVIVDGQGVAHPRRFGVASHLGLLLDIPTIGCAKSRLIGEYSCIAEEAGAHSLLIDKGEIIGAAVRTRKSVNPLYISIGHKIDLENSIHWVLNCCRGFRLPEPTRLAHLAANGRLDSDRCVPVDRSS
jgi:deoxyribonuclease V